MDRDLRGEDTNIRAGFSTLLRSATVKKKWQQIGRGLGLSPETLETIRQKHSQDELQCLYAALHAWLHGKEKVQTTLRALIRVLQSEEVDESAIAEKLKTEKGLQLPLAERLQKPVTGNVLPVGGELLHERDSTTFESIAGKESPESRAIRTNLTKITQLLSTAVSPIWFAQKLEEIAFMADASSRLVLGKTDSDNISMFMNAVKAQINSSQRPADEFTKFIMILQSQPALENLCQQLLEDYEKSGGNIDVLQKQLASRHSDTHREMLLESYLKSVYQQETHHSETDWPPTLDVEYVNLVLIRQERIESVSHHQEIVELSKRGQIQDILDHDKFHKLSLADITSYSAHRKVIVIEGAPGVGKTTLAHKLCHDWALKQLLGEFLLVLYIPLRVPLVRVAESLEDLLKYFGDNCTYADAQCIKESQGDKVLFVLDGWDELGPACRLKNVFFPKLIRGELLPECSVLVTSRPVAMDDIRQYANRLIQIIGFTEEQIHQYIYSYFKSITHIAVKLIEDLEQYPNVSSTCYIGINLTIVCYVYIACDYQLPSTLSEVYEQFIFHTIKRHFKRLSESQIDSKLSCVVTVNEFDGNVKEVLKNLGKLALEGLQKDEFSFSRDKLKEVCHIDESEAQFDGFGLLKLLHILRKHGTETYYHFLHLTVQEYLAAYSIAQMGEREQGDILESALIARDSSYEMVLKFFCGIDRFKSRPACFIFSQPNVVGVPIVLECIFEGQWEHGCQKVAKHTSRSFSIRHDIQPYRSLVIGYVMAKSGTTWELNMIGDRELKGMSQFILTVPTTLKRISILKASLTTESTKYLAEIIQSQVLLSELILSESHLNDDVVNTLCKALCIHKRLEILELTNNDLTSTSITTISDLVSQLPVLQRLDLGRNELSETTCKDILLAASASTSLREFCLPCASEELTKEAHALNITRLERGLHELTLIVPQHSFKN